MDGGRKVWEVTKRYDRDEFPDDSSSVGYAIDVYQETINKVFTDTCELQLCCSRDGGLWICAY